MARIGRTPAVLDWDLIGKLLEAGCDATGIAAQFGISRQVLYRRCKTDLNIPFATLTQQKRMTGDNLLRAKQYQTAMSGNVTMQIWLGKQRLGQTDKTQTQLTGKDGGPIETRDATLSDDERVTRIVALLDAARARRDRQAVGSTGGHPAPSAAGAAN